MWKRSKSWLIAVLIAVSSSALPAYPHSWYPWDCCTGEDCKTADRIERDDQGDYRIWVGRDFVLVPRFFPVRPSQDEHSHICYYEERDLRLNIPRCFFLPVGS